MLLEFSHKTYMSDVPYLQGQQQMHANRWFKLFETPKPEEDGNEVAADIINNLGLTVSRNEE